MKLLQCLCLLAACLALPAHAAELVIDSGHGTHRYSTAQLLERPDVRRIDIPTDVAYQRGMHYRAIPVRHLLDGIGPDDHLQFVAGDGFAAEIPAAVVLADHGSEAWLAIEDPAHPWPPLPGNHGRAGPFYLVWTDPQASHISPEQWPFQLATIRRLDSVASRFPAIVPAASVPPDSPVQRGFTVFQRTCFACHTLNGEGDSRLGPDLNIPYGPTEYLRADLLRAYIRNPQSLRHWPLAKMPGFPAQSLSDADLDAVISYLEYMAKHKRKP